jgi:hypothetical protein
VKCSEAFADGATRARRRRRSCSARALLTRAEGADGGAELGGKKLGLELGDDVPGQEERVIADGQQRQYCCDAANFTLYSTDHAGP